MRVKQSLELRKKSEKTIRNVPVLERPRERCLNHGPNVLSLRECIAVLLGSGPKGRGCLGLADDLLFSLGVLESNLSNDSQWSIFFRRVDGKTPLFAKTKGFGEASRSRLLVLFEILRKHRIYRSTENSCYREKPTEQSFEKIALQCLRRIPMTQRHASVEWFGFVPIYGDRVGEFCEIERGVDHHVNFSLNRFFAFALPLEPKAICLAHNHPSGYLNPSDVDRHLTQAVREACEMFSISLLGHWIVGPKHQRWLE